MLQEGLGTPKDCNKAIELLKAIENKMSVEFSYRMGVVYWDDDCFRKNVDLSIKLLTSAAEQGHAEAL